MIVLTGATGGLGSQVLKFLLQLIPSSEIAVSVHNPSGLPPHLAQSGISIRKGDYAHPESLDAAFAGADKLLIVSYPSIAHELRVKYHINAIDAAKRVGVKHVYYTSLAFADGSVAAVMQAHLDTEKYLRESGLTYTIIREGIYSESYPLYFGFFDPSSGKDEVCVPGDGPIAWVSREDLGEGTARLMVNGGYENQKLLLSGPQSNALTLTQLASLLSHILSRQITLKIVSVDEYVRQNVDESQTRGKEEYLRLWATTFQAMERGEPGKVDPLLGELVGRELKPMEVSLRELLGVKGEEGKAIEQYAK